MADNGNGHWHPDKWRNQTILGDSLEEARHIPDNTFDAIVTDPPYGLKFMGKAWDKGVPGVPFWKEFLRVCKPGAMALVFGGMRTWHRLACAMEDAGWEIRDTLMWLYGSGFPKSLDIGKAIDKAAGAEREIIGKSNRHGGGTLSGSAWNISAEIPDITAPATPEAAQWDGYGTSLKPAWEPVILAMNPIDGTYAENALRHGVAGINVDGCRIGTDDMLGRNLSLKSKDSPVAFQTSPMGAGSINDKWKKGRWPANLILDDEAGAMLDAQSGTLKSGLMRAGKKGVLNGYTKSSSRILDNDTYGDSGGASRFYYCTKASRKERQLGLNGRVNMHPTVKPLALMRWLVRLVSMPGGSWIFDPFAGSGTTGMACRYEGQSYTLIENEREHWETASARVSNCQELFYGK